jgi:T4 bacteriophage base plate protein
MKLPKLEYPIFDVTIPSNGKTIKMRPFLVKEEKLLLIAQTTGSPIETVNAIKQVVNNCILDESVDIEDITTFDLEYLFIKLRARSVNNVIDILYRDPEDQQQYKVTVNLDNVQVKRDPEHNTKIEINDDMGIILKYPRSDIATSGDPIGEDGEVNLYFKVIKGCLKSVYDSENVYEVSDYSNEEVEEFIQTLDVNTFKKVQKFLETMPRVYYETSYTNNEGVEKQVILQNLNDFFMLG